MKTKSETIPTGVKTLSESITEITSSGSYLIEKKIVMNGNFELPYGVTLYFEGGYLLGNGTLIGNHTRLVAPIEQIFYGAVLSDSVGDNGSESYPVNGNNDGSDNAGSENPDSSIERTEITPSGTWDIEVAYPHWFGMKTFKELWEGDYFFNINNFSKYDCAPAINNAIKMKQCGTVFIPKGRYIIDSTINLEPGIELVGESRFNGSGGEFPHTDTPDYGTYFYTMTGAKYKKGYVIEFNNNGKFNNFLSQGSVIRNIAFVNNVSNNPHQKCIYTRGGFELNNCIWDNFAQAVESSFDYSDFKKVINCTFNSSIENDNEDEWLYAFDLGGLGDALEFKRNAVHDKNYHKALRLDVCGGGVISSNILNSDVKISNCKGIVFEANHMEGGSQIEIISSTISLINNYIYKGKRPSVKINGGDWCDSAVVQLIGNLFLCRQSDTEAGLPGISEISPYELEFINNRTNAVDSRAYQVSLQQNYRYEYNTGEFGKQHTFGILACITSIDPDNEIVSQYEPFDEFNRYSYLTSENSLIMPNESVKFESYVNDLRADYSIYSQIHEGIKWHFKTGLYTYTAIAMFDKDRRIIGQYKNIDSYNIENYGILIYISDIKQWNSNLNLRLYRYGGDSLSVQTLYYVDIPICGGPYLYDNGITVNGYKWRPAESALDYDLYYNRNCNTDIESVSFTGNMVICHGATRPQYGTWKKGDVVFNISTYSEAAMWIYDGSRWFER
ncbi:MAG: hypothetical protein J1F10_07965 [Muribaculaceae bacterium]|nr:hypothetical protein [Muribaculaceae bacterium]